MDANEFATLYGGVLALEASNFARPAALATITRTFGATFRHAGTRMLVHEDGTVVCALSGGCPQRDIIERGRRAIEQGRAELARYDRESAFDVLMEMGCGGELEVLIEPLRSPADTRFLHAIACAHERRARGFMATAFARDGAAVATRHFVQAGAIEWHDIEDAALAAHARTLGSDAIGRAQSAGVDWLIEPITPPQVLVLIGVNAVSLALAHAGAALGWNSVLVESTPPDMGETLPQGARIEVAAPHAVREKIPCDADCALLAMTFNLERDLAYLRALAAAPFGYVGAIGSHERSARMREACAGVHLHAPAGLDVGARNPREIALAIAAEIIANRDARSGSSLSRR